MLCVFVCVYEVLYLLITYFLFFPLYHFSKFTFFFAIMLVDFSGTSFSIFCFYSTLLSFLQLSYTVCENLSLRQQDVLFEHRPSSSSYKF